MKEENGPLILASIKMIAMGVLVIVIGAMLPRLWMVVVQSVAGGALCIMGTTSLMICIFKR